MSTWYQIKPWIFVFLKLRGDKIRHKHVDQTVNILKCMWYIPVFLFQSILTLLLANCCLKYSDCLPHTLKSYSTAQTPSFNPGSPLLLWGLCEWQLSGGGIHMKPFHHCRPLGPAWLTAATVQKFSHCGTVLLYLHGWNMSLYECQTSMKKKFLMWVDLGFVMFKFKWGDIFFHER